MANIEPIKVEIEVDLKDVEDKVIERIAQEVAKRIHPQGPIWIDPRWYRPSYTPWWQTPPTSATGTNWPVWNGSDDDQNNAD